RLIMFLCQRCPICRYPWIRAPSIRRLPIRCLLIPRLLIRGLSIRLHCPAPMAAWAQPRFPTAPCRDRESPTVLFPGPARGFRASPRSFRRSGRAVAALEPALGEALRAFPGTACCPVWVTQSWAALGVAVLPSPETVCCSAWVTPSWAERLVPVPAARVALASHGIDF